MAYINKTDGVNLLGFGSEGFWSEVPVTMNGWGLQVPPKSKFLSLGVEGAPGANIASYSTLLFMETADGDVSMYQGKDPLANAWEMQDVSNQLYASLPSADFGSPFTTDLATLDHEDSGNETVTSALFTTKDGSALITSVLHDNRTIISCR